MGASEALGRLALSPCSAAPPASVGRVFPCLVCKLFLVVRLTLFHRLFLKVHPTELARNLPFRIPGKGVQGSVSPASGPKGAGEEEPQELDTGTRRFLPARAAAGQTPSRSVSPAWTRLPVAGRPHPFTRRIMCIRSRGNKVTTGRSVSCSSSARFPFPTSFRGSR